MATAFRNKEWWSKSIPAKNTKGEVTQKWMERPDDRRRLCKVLTAIYQSQDEESAAWQGRGNDATSHFKKKFAKPQTCENSSEEPDRKRKNKKTSKKKHSSSSSTEKPKKQRRKRNSSDSSTEVQVKQKSKKRQREVISSTECESERKTKRSTRPSAKKEAPKSKLAAALLAESSTDDEQAGNISPGELADIMTTLKDFNNSLPSASQWCDLANKFPEQFIKEHQLSETMSVLKNLKGPLKAKKRDLVLKDLSEICFAAKSKIQYQKTETLGDAKGCSADVSEGYWSIIRRRRHNERQR